MKDYKKVLDHAIEIKSIKTLKIAIELQIQDLIKSGLNRYDMENILFNDNDLVNDYQFQLNIKDKDFKELNELRDCQQNIYNFLWKHLNQILFIKQKKKLRGTFTLKVHVMQVEFMEIVTSVIKTARFYANMYAQFTYLILLTKENNNVFSIKTICASNEYFSLSLRLNYCANFNRLHYDFS